jgi:hypothetical protein
VEPNYGHVKKGEQLAEYDGMPVFQVAEFTEKPDYRTAQTYTESGEYLWNANFFVWASETLMKQFHEFEPEMHAQFVELQEAIQRPDFREAVRAIYPRIKKTAVDYAVLEPSARAGRMAVISAAMEWSDIGSWATLTDAFPPDGNGNLLLGPALAEETKNTTIFVRNLDRKVVATIGVDGFAIVDTKDAASDAPPVWLGLDARECAELQYGACRWALLEQDLRDWACPARDSYCGATDAGHEGNGRRPGRGAPCGTGSRPRPPVRRTRRQAEAVCYRAAREGESQQGRLQVPRRRTRRQQVASAYPFRPQLPAQGGADRARLP